MTMFLLKFAIYMTVSVNVIHKVSGCIYCDSNIGYYKNDDEYNRWYEDEPPDRDSSYLSDDKYHSYNEEDDDDDDNDSYEDAQINSGSNQNDLYEGNDSESSNSIPPSLETLAYGMLREIALPTSNRNTRQNTNTGGNTNQIETIAYENSNNNLSFWDENNVDTNGRNNNKETHSRSHCKKKNSQKPPVTIKVNLSDGENKNKNHNSKGRTDGILHNNDHFSSEKVNESYEGRENTNKRLSCNKQNHSMVVKQYNKERNKIENNNDDNWMGKVGGDYNLTSTKCNDLKKLNENGNTNTKVNKEGSLFSRNTPFEFREVFHKFMSALNSDKVYSDDGLIQKVNPKSTFLSSLFNVGPTYNRRNKPKAKEKLIISKGSYGAKFRIEGDNWKDKKPYVLVTDYKNNIKYFEDLDEDKRNKCLESALKSGKVFICLPVEKIKLKYDVGESPEVVLIKAILKEILNEYVDIVFERESIQYLTERLTRLML